MCIQREVKFVRSKKAYLKRKIEQSEIFQPIENFICFHAISQYIFFAFLRSGLFYFPVFFIF